MTLRCFFRLFDTARHFLVIGAYNLDFFHSGIEHIIGSEALCRRDTGVKKIEIVGADNQKVPGSVKAKVETAVDVAPNNYIKALKWRYPFPLGLWVYNNWPNPEKGFKHWIYEKLAEEPVLCARALSYYRQDTRCTPDGKNNSRDCAGNW